MSDGDVTGGDAPDEEIVHEFHDGADAPDCIVLRASSGKWVWVLIGSLVFLTFGAGLALGARTGAIAKGLGVVLIVMFGWCAVIALRQLMTPGALVITRLGFQVIGRGRVRSFAFAECGRFSVWRNPSRGSTMVVFDHVDDVDDLARMNRQLMGASRSLSESYGLPSQALADLLDDVRSGRRTPDTEA
jgi:hypothetical protein